MNDYFINMETYNYVNDLSECPNESFDKACYGLGIFVVTTNYGPLYYYGGDLWGYNSFYFHIPCLNISLSVIKNT